VENLTAEEKASIRAAFAVESVGEGRLYILENEMGANFVRALFPYEGSEKLNDLLEEGAHLHHIRYNRYLGGGTTDSVAFLEDRKFLSAGRRKEHIPAAALITMAPGKSSPFVFGGKLHTRHDTPDRVYEKPISEVLTVLDYAISMLESAVRPSSPRSLNEHHYARLYQDGRDLFLVMKDTIEPNGRNINSIFRVQGEIVSQKGTFVAKEVVWWGVETTLGKEMKDFRPGSKRVHVKDLVVEDDESKIHFVAPRSVYRKIQAWLSGLWGGFGRLAGRYSFLAMFLTALVVSYIPVRLLDLGLLLYPPLGKLVIKHYVLGSISMFILQLLILFRLFTRDLPSLMDNAYHHQNRFDNLRALRRMPL
jgi:hypothetical protein